MGMASKGQFLTGLFMLSHTDFFGTSWEIAFESANSSVSHLLFFSVFAFSSIEDEVGTCKSWQRYPHSDRGSLDSKGSNNKLIDDQKEDVAEGYFLDTKLTDSVTLIQNNLSSNSWTPPMCQVVWMLEWKSGWKSQPRGNTIGWRGMPANDRVDSTWHTNRHVQSTKGTKESYPVHMGEINLTLNPGSISY